MKSLNKYITESESSNDLLFESIINSENMTLENVYENMFDTLFETYQVNEGLFSKIGNALAELGVKAKKGGESMDKKIEKLSDAAKSAINTAKEKAGDAWDKVKDTYTNAVVAVDNAITASKETISQLAEKFKVKKEELEALVANTCANAIAQGKEIGKKLQEWTADATKFTAQMAASAAIVSAAKIAMAAGYNSNMIIDLLDAAGVK